MRTSGSRRLRDLTLLLFHETTPGNPEAGDEGLV